MALKIGYWGYSKDFSEPGDRRRFYAYATQRGLNIEYADPSREYDLVYLTYRADATRWVEYKRKYPKCKIIFELIDSYLTEEYTFKARLRGPLNFLTGASSRFYVDYRDGLRLLARLADAVICSTEEQRSEFLKYNANVHISLDMFGAEVLDWKKDFTPGSKLKLVWEGLPYTLHNVLYIKDVLNRLKDQVELHVVSDPYFYRFGKKYLRRETPVILKELQCLVKYWKWDKKTFVRDITQFDLAIIPINPLERMSVGKPENKLLLLWQMGMPVLTGATPAYQRAMQKAEVPMICDTINDWEKKIMDFARLRGEERQALAEKGRTFTQQNYSTAQHLSHWDNIIKSVI